MNVRRRVGMLLFGVVMVCLLIASCGEKKEGKVIVLEQEFVLRQDSEKAYVMDARGKVKNVGDVDLKNVVITGYCRSCGELINPGNWFISDIEKTADQKDTIHYLPINAEEEFAFGGVAFIYNTVSEKPATVPEKMEVVVESFETVQ